MGVGVGVAFNRCVLTWRFVSTRTRQLECGGSSWHGPKLYGPVYMWRSGCLLSETTGSQYRKSPAGGRFGGRACCFLRSVLPTASF